VLAEIGPVEIEVPRDRDASFAPVIRQRQRRLDGIDEIVLSLTARGLTTGEIAAHFNEVYGAKVSKDTIFRITDKVVEEMTEWENRPLDHAFDDLVGDRGESQLRAELAARSGRVRAGRLGRGHLLPLIGDCPSAVVSQPGSALVVWPKPGSKVTPKRAS